MEERTMIQLGLEQGSIRQAFARRVLRSPSTISRELKRVTSRSIVRFSMRELGV
jgi:IS30 family transposase